MTVTEVSSNGHKELSAKEEAAMLGVSERTVRRRRQAAKNGQPAAKKVTAGGQAAMTKPAKRPKVAMPDLPTDRALTWAVALVVGVLSYSHTVDLAIAAGHGWRAYLSPVALDGLTIAAIRAWRLGRHRIVAGIGVAVGLVGSVGANVLSMRPELVDMADVSAVLAAFPPIALAVVIHLVRR